MNFKNCACLLEQETDINPDWKLNSDEKDLGVNILELISFILHKFIINIQCVSVPDKYYWDWAHELVMISNVFIGSSENS